MIKKKRRNRQRRVIDVIPATFENVTFSLFLEREGDRRKCECLGERIDYGETLSLRMIHQWCCLQKLHYKTSYHYRKDYSLSKNLINAYWFLKSRSERWDIIYRR